MSLIVRKKCQEILDGAGLSEYHADISVNNNLMIVTTCGKQLFSISGIKFSKKFLQHLK